MRTISDSTRIKQKRGTGHGADYKPWITPSEYSGKGTTSSYPDWKHGRMISLLSQTERAVYVHLRWNDSNLDIREQFPLDPNRMAEIARSLGYKPVRTKNQALAYMTTDFLVTTESGPYAVSVESRHEDFRSSKRRIEKDEIEQEYWNSLGIPLTRITGEDLCMQEIWNIEDVVTYYNPIWVFDDFSKTRHLIATKKILIDMNRKIDYPKLIKELKETQIWNSIL